MGKIMIIKGADFSQNAIVRDFIEMPLMQSFYALTTGSVNESTYRFGFLSLLNLKQGQTITIKGLANVHDKPLYVEWVRYASPTPSTSTFVDTSNSSFINNYEGNDVFTFEIDTDGYYGFSFANDPTKNTTECLINDYAPISYCIE